jgi:hypothetical protein
MAENINPAAEQQFSAIIGRIFTDQSFAKAMEQNPEKALRDAGYKIDEHQAKALQSGAAEARNVAASDVSTAAFVRPVVSVLTKGTSPVVTVVTRSAVVASAAQSKEDK